MRKLLAAGLLAWSVLNAAGAGAAPLTVVAAENFYGDIAAQIGGPAVAVTSIISDPNQDPHQFTASASTVRLLADAALVIFNGADYDPWMATQLAAAKSRTRVAIEVARLVGKRAGDNPHIWYDPPTVPAAAKAIAAALVKADPANKADYDARLKTFLASLDPINERIAAMRKKFAGTEVTATEPVFGYMSTALGLKMRNERFQLAVMNDTEPSARDIAAFLDDLKRKRVKALFYNNQVTDDLTEKLLAAAKDAGVPIVGVTETKPDGVTFQAWILGQLTALEAALAGGR